MNIFYRFLLSLSIVLTGCAISSAPGTPGFQKSYPWTFVPYTNAPWTSIVSFNDFIDLEPFYLNNEIRKSKAEQDSKGIPLNSLSQSLMSQY